MIIARIDAEAYPKLARTVKEKITWGEVDKIAQLLHDISSKKGIGAILAEGIRYAAKTWDMEDVAIHVKGLDPAGYDPRVLKGMGLANATSDRGACHLRATFYKAELAGMIPMDQMEGKAKLFLEFEDRFNIHDALILCRFYRDLYCGPHAALILANSPTGYTEDMCKIAKRKLISFTHFTKSCPIDIDIKAPRRSVN
jgi:aldehyde:ferredoxin oxidoreductase